MKGMRDSINLLFGGTMRMPKKGDYSKKAAEAHAFKRTSEEKQKRLAAIRHEMEEGLHGGNKWRFRRWASIILWNLLFVLSFQLDIQLVEGALTASRFVGFHMADLNSALQVMLAYKEVLINLAIGSITVLLLWWLLGGRTFCSWVCPYHLVAEWAEWLHLKLVARKIIKDHPLDRRLRTVLYVIFAFLAFASGYTVFETISPVGILSRSFTYGASLALVWVGFLLLIEIFYSRRFWCRYICPIGLTYGIVGTTSPTQIRYNLNNCLHEGECRKVCMVPHVLDVTKLNYAKKVKLDIGADCTRCGMCVDVCPTEALTFRIKGLDKLL
ncbi:NapH/MauN family ferredoxin-type protein [Magnetospira sp. QH-2]|uniref:NapH/MauN family ferredoxin-type protein n=1 Tax=Magnetospira sp. (strain QH-2) TaxID=1288970 RepID=UPI0003E810B4|nr:NapH/MauN family ferredoxin-type protein [Magnetospira sp. QH-2]CCQ73147.1 Ferredoxin-type protein, NapH/MauN family [Magnetospira sp. QH-2]